MLALLLQTAPPETAEISRGEVFAKVALMLLAASAAGLLPWLLRGVRTPLLRAFRRGAVYALLPAVVAGAALASLAAGISLSEMKNGKLDAFWPLPVTIFAFILAGETVGGLLAVAVSLFAPPDTGEGRDHRSLS